jgi:hypothetical protein
MLSIPAYIEKSAIVGAAIKYRWNDGDLPTFYTESDRIQSMIAKTTTAGAIALALGCLEWVAWRLSKHAEVTVLLQAVEAMWAGIIDVRYVRSLRDSPFAINRREWQGAERGPVYVAYKQLKDLRSCLDSKEPASPEASCAVRMGRFVLPAAEPFETWWRFVLKRLVETHPASEEGPDDVGRPIPRDALDPDVDYKPDDALHYLSGFLASLKPASNPFLASAEEMKEAGFGGDPYKL